MITISEIQKIVAEKTGIPVEVFNAPEGTEKVRKTEKVAARHLSMFFSRRFTKKSLYAIGEAHGRDHATVINAIRVVKNALDTNDQRIVKHFYEIDRVIRFKMNRTRFLTVESWIKRKQTKQIA